MHDMQITSEGEVEYFFIFGFFIKNLFNFNNMFFQI